MAAMSPGFSEVLKRADRRRSQIFGFRIAALGEIAGFFAVILLADYFLFGNDRFASVEPHPYWAIILLVATQYGTGEGLLAALLATVLFLTKAPEQGFDEDLYTWILRITTVPVLWFITALIVGEIRASHRRERYDLLEQLGMAREEAEAITEAYERQAQIKADLEARVAAQVRTVRAMYDASRAIDKKNTSEVIVGIASLVRAVLGPKKFSLFLLGASGLELVAADGWAASDVYASEFSSASELFQAVAVRQEVLVAVNPEHELLLGGEGVIAGPLVTDESRVVMGMLKIEEIGFAQFNPATMQNFRIVCEWIATAYDNAQEFERLYASRALPPSLVQTIARF